MMIILISPFIISYVSDISLRESLTVHHEHKLFSFLFRIEETNILCTDSLNVLTYPYPISVESVKRSIGSTLIDAFYF